jgi:hypothetical protein
MPGFWREWLALFESGTQSDPSRALRLSAAWARIGDASRSADWLERAYAERDPGLVYVGIDPAWKRVRDEPRTAAILDRMQLPHQASAVLAPQP